MEVWEGIWEEGRRFLWLWGWWLVKWGPRLQRCIRAFPRARGHFRPAVWTEPRSSVKGTRRLWEEPYQHNPSPGSYLIPFCLPWLWQSLIRFWSLGVSLFWEFHVSEVIQNESLCVFFFPSCSVIVLIFIHVVMGIDNLLIFIAEQ